MEAAKIRKKLALGSTYKTELFKTSSTSSQPGEKRLVVDEEAYFNYQEKEKQLKTMKEGSMDDKEVNPKGYDKFSEPNLAKKLGLENETDETIVKKDDGKKKSKEELEKDVPSVNAERHRGGEEDHLGGQRQPAASQQVHERGRPSRPRHRRRLRGADWASKRRR